MSRMIEVVKGKKLIRKEVEIFSNKMSIHNFLAMRGYGFTSFSRMVNGERERISGFQKWNKNNDGSWAFYHAEKRRKVVEPMKKPKRVYEDHARLKNHRKVVSRSHWVVTFYYAPNEILVSGKQDARTFKIVTTSK